MPVKSLGNLKKGPLIIQIKFAIIKHANTKRKHKKQTDWSRTKFSTFSTLQGGNNLRNIFGVLWCLWPMHNGEQRKLSPGALRMIVLKINAIVRSRARDCSVNKRCERPRVCVLRPLATKRIICHTPPRLYALLRLIWKHKT